MRTLTLTPNPKREKVTLDGYVTRFYDWAELATFYREIVNPETDVSWDRSGAIDSTLRPAQPGDWSGASAKQIVERLDDGYDLPALDGVATPSTLEAEKARWRWTDNPEGEYQHDAFLNGEADYYVLRDRIGPKPGINIEVAMNFSASVNESIIGQYGTFVGQTIRAMQGQGYDCAITLITRESRLLDGERKSGSCITVSRFGEVIMAHDWSAIFSPGGFRHLVFAAYIMPGFDENARVYSSLGHPEPRKNEFDIEFDRDSRTIRIHCDARSYGGSFPAAALTDKLAKLNILDS